MLRYLAIILYYYYSNSYSLLSVPCVPDNNSIYALLGIVIIYITFVIERKSIRRLSVNIN